MSYFVFFCMFSVSGSGSSVGEERANCLILLTCNYVVSVGEVSSSSGCLGGTTLVYCETCFPYNYFGGPSVTRLSSINSIDAFLLGKA